MTLKKKILLGYGVAFVLMVLVIAWAVTNLVSLGKASEAILSENYRSILAAENMVDCLERQDSAILLIFIGNTEKGVAQFRNSETSFLQWLSRAKDNITIPGEADLVHAIEAGYSTYCRKFSDMIDWSAPVSRTPADYQETIYPDFVKVRDACINLRKMNEDTMYAASVRAGKVAGRAVWSTVFVAASALVAALLFSFFLAERIARPLRRFMDATQRIARGDYTVQVPVETGDELGHLAGEFNQMAARLGRYHEMNIDQIISEKTKSEAILSSIEDGMVVFDTSLAVSSINPAACRMLEMNDPKTLPLHCADILKASYVCDLIQTTVDIGTPPDIRDEQRIMSIIRGERSHHYLFSITPIRRRGRTLDGIVLLLKDVTRLREVERLKSEFIMAASHELRTPLTSLGMSVDLLLEHGLKMLPERDRELLEAAHEEVHRMKALVNDLLDLSKIESGKIELEFESVSLPPLFEQIRTVFKSQMEMKKIVFKTRSTDGLPDIRADANKITWVLSNLVSNALRYVGKGGHIELSAQRAGAYIQLSVLDDGPGILPEYQSKIFEKFIQVKGREGGGTGLGLAICKEIVRAHGGTIWVDSVPERGSTFTFTLPVWQ